MPIIKEDLMIWDSYINESMSLYSDPTEKYEFYKSYKKIDELINDFEGLIGHLRFDKLTKKSLNELFTTFTEISDLYETEEGREELSDLLIFNRQGVGTYTESVTVKPTKPKKADEFTVQVTFRVPPHYMEDREHKEGRYILKIPKSDPVE